MRPRSFMCPDEIWTACERIAWQTGRSLDDVLTEALGAYVRDRGMTAPPPGRAPTPPPPPMRAPSAPPPPRPANAGGYGAPPFPPPGPPPPAYGAPPPPAYGAPPPPAYGAPPPPAYGAYPMPPPPPPYSPPQPGPTPHPPPGGYGGQAPQTSDGPPAYALFLYCEGQRAQIMQPRFVIGRSRSASDFAINDSNVSRQHAAVEWLRGHYHIVDLGSTNGILFQGRRVERKVLYDGDEITLAGHTLRFARQ